MYEAALLPTRFTESFFIIFQGGWEFIAYSMAKWNVFSPSEYILYFPLFGKNVKPLKPISSQSSHYCLRHPDNRRFTTTKQGNPAEFVENDTLQFSCLLAQTFINKHHEAPANDDSLKQIFVISGTVPSRIICLLNLILRVGKKFFTVRAGYPLITIIRVIAR